MTETFASGWAHAAHTLELMELMELITANLGNAKCGRSAYRGARSIPTSPRGGAGGLPDTDAMRPHPGTRHAGSTTSNPALISAGAQPSIFLACFSVERIFVAAFLSRF